LTDEVLKAFERKRLQKLSRTYVSLSFNDVWQVLPYSCGVIPTVDCNFIDSSSSSSAATSIPFGNEHVERLLHELEQCISGTHLLHSKIDLCNRLILFNVAGPNAAEQHRLLMTRLHGNMQTSQSLTEKVRELHAEVTIFILLLAAIMYI
jgi:hypothetical protein